MGYIDTLCRLTWTYVAHQGWEEDSRDQLCATHRAPSPIERRGILLPTMTRYLVLLRGINVGGRNKVPMAALRELLESHGHTKVSTYIASGNVILSSDRSAAAIKRELEEALPKTFKLDSELIAVLVLTLRPAPGRRPEAAQGLRRPAGDVPQRRGLPHGDRRADGDEGLRPAARRRRGVAGQPA